MHAWMRHPGLIGPVELFVGFLFFAIVLGLLAIATIFIIRSVSRGKAVAPGLPVPAAGVPAVSSGPLAILEERFAKGEIDEDEFKRRRDVLRGGA